MIENFLNHQYFFLAGKLRTKYNTGRKTKKLPVLY